MATYEVILKDRTSELIDAADAYQQEGQMTTFFATAGKQVVDCWSTRLASFRTSEVLIIRRLSDAVAADASLPVRGEDMRPIALADLRSA